MIHNKPIIGITGNFGAGKSTVCEVLTKIGGCRIDADELAHEVVSYGSPAYEKILEHFGKDILRTGSKEIDRKKLGKIVFGDRVQLKELEDIVHKDVLKAIALITEHASFDPSFSFVVWDAPLLVDTNLHRECDLVCLIVANRQIKLRRTTLRDHITLEEAMLKLASQPSEEYLKYKLIIDLGQQRVRVLENNGKKTELMRNMLEILKDVKFI